MKYASRAPKLYSLNKLLKLFREKGISYSTERFKGERANRFYSLLTIALDENKWETLHGEVRVKDSDLSFPDIRFSKQNYKRFKDYMEKIKADFFLPQEQKPYKENKVPLAQEVLLISILEDKSGVRRVSNPFKDWGIRTDRLLKAKVIQLKKAEGEPLEKNMKGVSVEDVSAHLTDTQDQAIEERFILPLIERQRVTNELIEEKIKEFVRFPSRSIFNNVKRSGFINRLHNLKKAVSSNGKSYGEELNQLLMDTSLSFAGSAVEKFVALEADQKDRSKITLPDFIDKMALDMKAAKFSFRGGGKYKREEEKTSLLESFKKSLKDYLELNRDLGLISDINLIKPNYQPHSFSLHVKYQFFNLDKFFNLYKYDALDKFFNNAVFAIRRALEKKAEAKDFYVEEIEKSNFFDSLYITHLHTLRSFIGEHPEITQQINEGKPLDKIPQSIKSLNLTPFGREKKEAESQLSTAFKSLTPLSKEDELEVKVRKERGWEMYTSPQYPNLTLIIRGGLDMKHKQESWFLKAGFFALNVVHLNSGKKSITIDLVYGKIRAFYDHEKDLVNIDRISTASVLIHEIMHSLEYANPKVQHLVNAFYATRFKPENYIEYQPPLTHIRQVKEMTFKGLWDPYVGKIYLHGGSEFITMGVQEFFSEKSIKELVSKDYAHFLFCHALVTGKLKEYL